MKKLMIATIGIFFYQSSLAQTKPSDYLSFSIGATVPTGAFAKTDPGSFNNYNNTSGFANTGIAFGFDWGHYLASRWSIKGSLYFSEHGGISPKNNAILASNYQDAYGVDQADVRTTNTYKALNLMVGPGYSISLKKLIIDAWLLGGIITSLSTPQIAITLTDGGVTDPTFTQKSSMATAFGWQVGAGARYKLTEKFSLILKGDYFNSSGIAIENANRVNNAGRLVTNQPLSWVNLTTGLALSIGNRKP